MGWREDKETIDDLVKDFEAYLTRTATASPYTIPDFIELWRKYDREKEIIDRWPELYSFEEGRKITKEIQKFLKRRFRIIERMIRKEFKKERKKIKKLTGESREQHLEKLDILANNYLQLQIVSKYRRNCRAVEWYLAYRNRYKCLSRTMDHYWATYLKTTWQEVGALEIWEKRFLWLAQEWGRLRVEDKVGEAKQKAMQIYHHHQHFLDYSRQHQAIIKQLQSLQMGEMSEDIGIDENQKPYLKYWMDKYQSMRKKVKVHRKFRRVVQPVLQSQSTGDYFDLSRYLREKEPETSVLKRIGDMLDHGYYEWNWVDRLLQVIRLAETCKEREVTYSEKDKTYLWHVCNGLQQSLDHGFLKIFTEQYSNRRQLVLQARKKLLHLIAA